MAVPLPPILIVGALLLILLLGKSLAPWRLKSDAFLPLVVDRRDDPWTYWVSFTGYLVLGGLYVVFRLVSRGLF